MKSKESTYRAEIQERGRITVPKSIRQGLGIRAGDLVDITIKAPVWLSLEEFKLKKEARTISSTSEDSYEPPTPARPKDAKPLESSEKPITVQLI